MTPYAPQRAVEASRRARSAISPFNVRGRPPDANWITVLDMRPRNMVRDAMPSRGKPTIVSGTGTVLSAFWAVYSFYNTASDLPADAGKIAKIMADPPIYLPWLILAACVLVLAWSLWPHNDEASSEGSPSFGDTYSQTHHGSGDNTMNF